MELISPNKVAQLLNVSRGTLEKFFTYEQLLKKWNSKINLVSASTLDDFWGRHILDSGQLIHHLPPHTRILVDLGSGAGFPGMVLAIMGVQEVHLIETDAKKCAFLENVSRETLTDVIIHQYRIENLKNIEADVITARALADVPTLLNYSKNFVKKDTVGLFLKGEQVESELTAKSDSWQVVIEKIPSISSTTGSVLKVKWHE
ncbi:MAG: 16S rRNA (guanine(527)-N(7))-methyltransferase RsmG [Dongiaceae bacterium]